MVDSWASSRREMFLSMAAKAESWAEVGLLWAMVGHRGPDEYTFGPGCEWTMVPQQEIRTAGRAYRVDVAVVRGNIRVAIEVDGHAYHHANEKQEARDACRDWALNDVGWEVVRIDAWRLIQSPTSALAEAMNQIERIAARSHVRRKKPIEQQSDEELKTEIDRLGRSANDSQLRGMMNEAECHRRTADRMSAYLEKRRAIQRLKDASGDAAAEEEILRKLFEDRAKKLRLGAA